MLSTGTAISQLIIFLSTLVLARLYTESDYGDLSNFMAITGIIGGVAAFRYELTIILPKENTAAKNILIFCILSSIFVALGTFLVLYIFQHKLLGFLNLSNNISFLVSVSLGVFLLGVYNTFENWLNRKADYKKITNIRIVYSLSSTVFKILFGVFSISLGLIYGNILGYVLVMLMLSILLLKKTHTDNFKDITWKNIQSQVIEYKDFFKYSTPGSILNTVSNIGLPLLITYFYSLELAGMYFFANNIVRQPLGFITTSIAQVFKKEAAGLYHNSPESLIHLTKKIQKNILLFTIPILLLLSFFGAPIFSLIFGNQWYESGNLIKFFAISVLLNVNYSPISSLADILRKQKFLLVFNFSNIFFQVLILYLFSNLLDFNYMILLVSLSVALHFLYIDIYIKRILKRRFNEKINQ